MPLVTSGVEHGNIRELVMRRMKDLCLPCRDVRSREVGIKQIHEKVNPDEVCTAAAIMWQAWQVWQARLDVVDLLTPDRLS